MKHLYLGAENGYYWYVRLHETTGYVYAKEAKWKGKMTYVGRISQWQDIVKAYSLTRVGDELKRIAEQVARRKCVCYCYEEPPEGPQAGQ